MAKNKHAISPSRAENFPEWYQQVVRAAEMAETSPTRGCMIIKPWGYGLWENIQARLDKLIKDTGHQNAYFPLLIPLNFLEKEAEHAEGFATECAVVTHHRLEAEKDIQSGKTKLVPRGKLREAYVVRPTSETIIGDAFSRWTQSYRDLPLMINQWANVMRWEMRPRLFLRTAEFLWQEGHTAHETKEEALEECEKMHKVYRDFLRDFLALPSIIGEKTARERFPGADITLTLEVMAQDRKAIQAGTSHFLGQNFARSSDIKFLSREGKQEYAWTTSWGVSSRLVGAMLMVHADDDGAVIPPALAASQIVISPILPKDEAGKAEVMRAVQNLRKELMAQRANFGEIEDNLRVEIDKRDLGGGAKRWQWVKKGVPIFVEVGQRDLLKDSICFTTRDDFGKKRFLPREEFCACAANLLEEMQKRIYEKALNLLRKNTEIVTSYEEFEKIFGGKENGSGKFVLCPWAGEDEEEEKLQQQFKVSARCLLDKSDELYDAELFAKPCVLTKKKAKHLAVFARSY